jgi:hypothetical protein
VDTGEIWVTGSPEDGYHIPEWTDLTYAIIRFTAPHEQVSTALTRTEADTIQSLTAIDRLAGMMLVSARLKHQERVLPEL